MGSNFDESDFIDSDFQAHKGVTTPVSTVIPSTVSSRPPTREEIEAKVSDTQSKLAELKRVQEELERERAALEEARRRRMEFQNGQEEMLQHLTRGVALLEESEFAARRESEQMSKSLVDLRAALAKVQAIKEESWTKDSFNNELTKALSTIENSRMEYNSARLKWKILDGPLEEAAPGSRGSSDPKQLLANYDFLALCRVGLALNWPIAAVALIGVIILAIVLRR